MKNKTVLAMLCGALMGLAGCNDEHDASQPSLNDSISQPTLVAFAKLPVDTYASGPDSGKAVKGANGIYPPFKGQPVQGFSAALKTKMAAIWLWRITVSGRKIILPIFYSEFIN